MSPGEGGGTSSGTSRGRTVTGSPLRSPAAPENQALASGLTDLARATAEAEQVFMAAHGEEVEAYRRHLTEGIRVAKEALCLDVGEISGEHPLCVELAQQATDYVDWLQWSLWDLPYFAVANACDAETFRQRVGACAQVYLSGRVFDDVLDRHFWYKGQRPTLFSMVADGHPKSDGVESLTVLSGLLLLSEGLMRLSESDMGDELPVLRKVLGSLRRTVIGAILEQGDRETWSHEYYERLVHLKNVDFWRLLYSSVDPDRSSPLYPFLERYYALAQKLNDVQDFADDLRRGQPNLLSLHLRRQDRTDAATLGVVPPAAEQHLAMGLLDLHERAQKLEQPHRGVALLKLGETLAEARRLGLFADALAETSADTAPDGAETSAAAIDSAGEPIGLHWFSHSSDVIEQYGADALVRVHCPVCDQDDARHLFEQQGFDLHRCRECEHVYVDPRVDLDIQLRMAAELEEFDDENQFLEVQRIYAEPICHLLRLRTLGPRLLDLGFGRGYILQLARAYGFEVYGMDISEYLADRLRPELGERLHTGALGATPIPWGQFDVVVMSHVVEHLADPGAVLTDVWNALRPGGVLFVAVPDIGSLQFRIFGKRWDVVNPLVHFQYFNEESLSRLLLDCGYHQLERIEYPPLPRELTPGWMRLMRKLGGDESGELAMVAQRPALERLTIGLDASDEPGPENGDG